MLVSTELSHSIFMMRQAWNRTFTLDSCVGLQRNIDKEVFGSRSEWTQ